MRNSNACSSVTLYLLSVDPPGYGSVVARFNTTQERKDSLIIGKLSAFNIWNRVLTQPEIRRFAIGCGYEVGNLLRWRELFNLASGVSAKIQSATCRHGHGKAEVTWSDVVRLGESRFLRQSSQIYFPRVQSLGFAVIETAHYEYFKKSQVKAGEEKEEEEGRRRKGEEGGVRRR